MRHHHLHESTPTTRSEQNNADFTQLISSPRVRTLPFGFCGRCCFVHLISTISKHTRPSFAPLTRIPPALFFLAQVLHAKAMIHPNEVRQLLSLFGLCCCGGYWDQLRACSRNSWIAHHFCERRRPDIIVIHTLRPPARHHYGNQLKGTVDHSRDARITVDASLAASRRAVFIKQKFFPCCVANTPPLPRAFVRRAPPRLPLAHWQHYIKLCRGDRGSHEDQQYARDVLQPPRGCGYEEVGCGLHPE